MIIIRVGKKHLPKHKRSFGTKMVISLSDSQRTRKDYNHDEDKGQDSCYSNFNLISFFCLLVLETSIIFLLKALMVWRLSRSRFLHLQTKFQEPRLRPRITQLLGYQQDNNLFISSCRAEQPLLQLLLRAVNHCTARTSLHLPRQTCPPIEFQPLPIGHMNKIRR